MQKIFEGKNKNDSKEFQEHAENKKMEEVIWEKEGL